MLTDAGMKLLGDLIFDFDVTVKKEALKCMSQISRSQGHLDPTR